MRALGAFALRALRRVHRAIPGFRRNRIIAAGSARCGHDFLHFYRAHVRHQRLVGVATAAQRGRSLTRPVGEQQRGTQPPPMYHCTMIDSTPSAGPDRCAHHRGATLADLRGELARASRRSPRAGVRPGLAVIPAAPSSRRAGEARYRQLQEELAALSSRFQDNVLDATNDFGLVVTDRAQLAGTTRRRPRGGPGGGREGRVARAGG